MNSCNHFQTRPLTNVIESYNIAINERPDNALKRLGSRNKRSIGEHSRFWSNGKTIKILVFSFNELSFELVKQGASKWLPYVNLKFEFIEMEEDDIFSSDELLGDIRVDFQPQLKDGGTSALGTDALSGHPHAPSMSLGTDFSSPVFEQTVIHEFGHALGLNHAHQHPDANIPWDRKKAYYHYAKVAGMSKSQVDAQVFALERTSSQTYAPYDRHSVMHYQIFNELTVGDWHQPLNKNISEGDIAFMRQIYP